MGGSWLAITRAISTLHKVLSSVHTLRTLLISPHAPPSTVGIP